jgi:hypothetical protein
LVAAERVQALSFVLGEFGFHGHQRPSSHKIWRRAVAGRKFLRAHVAFSLSAVVSEYSSVLSLWATRIWHENVCP